MKAIQLTHKEVMDILPHREPMLLVDTVSYLESLRRIEAQYYIAPDLDIFKGHFPGKPVFPGVMSVECMAQAVDIMVMTAPKYAGKTPLFLGINNVRFTKKIQPGDTLTTRAELISEREEKSIVTCKAMGYIGEEQAVSAEIIIAMR